MVSRVNGSGEDGGCERRRARGRFFILTTIVCPGKSSLKHLTLPDGRSNIIEPAGVTNSTHTASARHEFTIHISNTLSHTPLPEFLVYTEFLVHFREEIRRMVRLVVAALGCLAVASAYTPSVAPSGALLAKPAISIRASGKLDSPRDLLLRPQRPRTDMIDT